MFMSGRKDDGLVREDTIEGGRESKAAEKMGRDCLTATELRQEIEEECRTCSRGLWPQSWVIHDVRGGRGIRG